MPLVERDATKRPLLLNLLYLIGRVQATKNPSLNQFQMPLFPLAPLKEVRLPIFLSSMPHRTCRYSELFAVWRMCDSHNSFQTPPFPFEPPKLAFLVPFLHPSLLWLRNQ